MILTFIKKALIFIYNLFWSAIQHVIKNDKRYLSFKFLFFFRKKLHWDNPQTFNEKLNWLKINWRADVLTKMADKIEAKKIVSEIIGPEYVIPLLGVWDRAEDIDFAELPNEFVLKCNHNSGGGMCICKNKSLLNISSVKKDLDKGLCEDHYLLSREWPYKNIPHRILAEQLLKNANGDDINDYKWWCFNGEPKYMYRTLKSKNKSDVFENFYDMEYNPIMIDHGFPRRVPEFERPKEFEEMKKLATALSQGFPFVRIDFFNVEGHVFFSEFTFYDWAGMRPFNGDWDLKIGDLLTLPQR